MGINNAKLSERGKRKIPTHNTDTQPLSKPTRGVPFPKGYSPNPGGRPGGTKGLAAYIKKLTKDGFDLADLMWEIASGDHQCYMNDRVNAIRWLADRGFGKVQDSLHVSGGLNLAQLLLEVKADNPAITQLKPAAPSLVEGEGKVIEQGEGESKCVSDTLLLPPPDDAGVPFDDDDVPSPVPAVTSDDALRVPVDSALASLPRPHKTRGV